MTFALIPDQTSCWCWSRSRTVASFQLKSNLPQLGYTWIWRSQNNRRIRIKSEASRRVGSREGYVNLPTSAGFMKREGKIIIKMADLIFEYMFQFLNKNWNIKIKGRKTHTIFVLVIYLINSRNSRLLTIFKHTKWVDTVLLSLYWNSMTVFKWPQCWKLQEVCY